MSASVLHFVEWLESTRWSVALHGSIWAYPIIESVHVLMLCLFLGLALMLDLRLMGVSFRRIPVTEISERLLPWTIFGFSVMAITGALLFYGIPVRTYNNVFFRLKIVMLILAGLNIWYFHTGIYKQVAVWGNDERPPAKARFAGAVSLALWVAIVIAGRFIAYNWFEKTIL